MDGERESRCAEMAHNIELSVSCCLQDLKLSHVYQDSIAAKCP